MHLLWAIWKGLQTVKTHYFFAEGLVIAHLMLDGSRSRSKFSTLISTLLASLQRSHACVSVTRSKERKRLPRDESATHRYFCIARMILTATRQRSSLSHASTTLPNVPWPSNRMILSVVRGFDRVRLASAHLFVP